METNPMKKIKVEKVTINIGVGEGGERLRKAERVIEMLTGQKKPLQTISKVTNRDLGIRKGMPIGCKVTLRSNRATEFCSSFKAVTLASRPQKDRPEELR